VDSTAAANGGANCDGKWRLFRSAIWLD